MRRHRIARHQRQRRPVWTLEPLPFTRDDLTIMQRFTSEPEAAGIYNWTGFRNPNAHDGPAAIQRAG